MKKRVSGLQSICACNVYMCMYLYRKETSIKEQFQNDCMLHHEQHTSEILMYLQKSRRYKKRSHEQRNIHICIVYSIANWFGVYRMQLECLEKLSIFNRFVSLYKFLQFFKKHFISHSLGRCIPFCWNNNNNNSNVKHIKKESSLKHIAD